MAWQNLILAIRSQAGVININIDKNEIFKTNFCNFKFAI